MRNAILMGLTGMSGAGKTTVCDFFRQKGIAVIDCDKISRLVVQKGSPCLEEIDQNFDDILTDEGELNRKKLGEIIFSDKNKKIKLENIIFPYILFEVFNRVKAYEQQGENFIILDAPTLFESGIDKFCDYIVSVVAKTEISAERISKRDETSLENAKLRLNSQKNREFFIKNSTYYIDNEGEIDELIKKAEFILNELLTKKQEPVLEGYDKD